MNHPDSCVQTLSGAVGEGLGKFTSRQNHLAAEEKFFQLWRAFRVPAGGGELTLELRGNCLAVAAEAGHAPDEAALERTRQSLTETGSTLTASMLRDIQRGGPIEADHIVGDMIERAGRQRASIPLLHIAYAHLRAYEATRLRAS